MFRRIRKISFYNRKFVYVNLGTLACERYGFPLARALALFLVALEITEQTINAKLYRRKLLSYNISGNILM